MAPPGHIIFVSPHPDDELLAAGATLASASDAGTSITIIGVTNGELSHPYLDASQREELGKRREQETISAYKHAGIEAERIALAASDGSVGHHLEETEKKISENIRKDTICIAPWEGDGHPDHQACGLAAQQACSKNKTPLFFRQFGPGTGTIHKIRSFLLRKRDRLVSTLTLCAVNKKE